MLLRVLPTGHQSPLRQVFAALSGAVVAPVAGACLAVSASAADLLNNDAQNVNASLVYDNILTILPFIAIIALLLAIMFAFFLPRYVGFPLVVGALAMLANFAPQIVNLLWGRGDDAVTAGAELFAPEQIRGPADAAIRPPVKLPS